MDKSEKILRLVNSGEREYRQMKIEAVAYDSDAAEKEYIVRGFATTFNQPYHLYTERFDGDYKVEVREQMDAHAFDDTDMSDVIMQYDHEGRVFARQKNGTLSLSIEDVGLGIEANLGGTRIGRELYEEIAGGYTDKMSIGFTVTNAVMEKLAPSDGFDEVYLRTIRKVGKLYDVSAVSIPANDFTSISARTVCNGVIAEVEAERLQAKERAEKRRKLLERVEVMKGGKTE